MNINEYLLHFTGAIHKALVSGIEDLTTEQFLFRPMENGNHIAFNAWHLIRTEDNIVQFVVQRKPTVWLEQGLDEKWTLPKVEQGTGMDPERAHALVIPSPAELLGYANDVWAKTESFIAAATEDDLNRMTKVMPFGEMPVVQALGQTIITHGNQHFGEICTLRNLQGITGVGF